MQIVDRGQHRGRGLAASGGEQEMPGHSGGGLKGNRVKNTTKAATHPSGRTFPPKRQAASPITPIGAR